jgi:hypothetical protein
MTTDQIANAAAEIEELERLRIQLSSEGRGTVWQSKLSQHWPALLAIARHTQAAEAKLAEAERINHNLNVQNCLLMEQLAAIKEQTNEG